jgi:hypothetical protein
MKNFRNIVITFIIGAFCRYIFFISYGYFYFIAAHYGFKANLSGLLPKLFGAAFLQFQSIFETLIVAPISIFVPAIIFGYYINESKRLYLLYSLSSFAGMICFDIFYYSFVINDLDLLLNNYLPMWYGIIIIFMWLVLFYLIYSLGKHLRRKRQLQ